MKSTIENQNTSLSEDLKLSLSFKSIDYLTETGKWGKFLSILGFIFVGLVMIAALTMGGLMSGNSVLPIPGFVFGFIYVVIGALYFFPIYYLFKFSTKIKAAIINQNDMVLEGAFENLKSLYKFMGVFSIVILSIYLAFGIGALIVGLISM